MAPQLCHDLKPTMCFDRFPAFTVWTALEGASHHSQGRPCHQKYQGNIDCPKVSVGTVAIRKDLKNARRQLWNTPMRNEIQRPSRGCEYESGS
jgi:hypothetical protein